MSFLTGLTVLLTLAAAELREARGAGPVEISPQHPLLVFSHRLEIDLDAPSQAAGIYGIWEALPESLRPMAAIKLRVEGIDVRERQARLAQVLPLVTPVPLVIEAADGIPENFLPLDRLPALFRDHENIVGVHVSGLEFNEYYEFGDMDPLGTPPAVRWLIRAIEITAGSGRFISIALDELHWPRIMSNAWCRTLYEAIWQNRAYVIPLNAHRGSHNIARHSALMGLWLEGAVEHWGLAASPEWYRDANFDGPGALGAAENDRAMPPAFYRAMILNGAMSGAEAFFFEDPRDLWGGSGSHAWDEAIFPTLVEVIERGYIARKDLVSRKARVAYQLDPSRTSADFHRNLRDIDGVLDQGALLHGAYGMELPGQVPELVLNDGRYFWVPILSPYAPVDALNRFGAVVRPEMMAGVEHWKSLLAAHYPPGTAGTAFVTAVGRGVFVMHTRENLYEEQTFYIPDVPAPVRGLKAQRTPAGVLLSWPFREEDIAYTVYQRVPPAITFVPIVRNIDDRRFLVPDRGAGGTVIYGVAALTGAKEPYSGTVNYGDYLVVNRAQSRIAEEVVVTPSSTLAFAKPVRPLARTRPKRQAWSAGLDDLEGPQRRVAEEVVERIDAWARAFERETLNGIVDLYAQDYADSEGGDLQQVRTAYHWFFDRYDGCHMRRQIRRWDFSGTLDLSRVSVLLHCRFMATAQTDATGRFADIPVHFPRTTGGDVWVTFSNLEGPWRIVETNPAVPDFDDLFGAPMRR